MTLRENLNRLNIIKAGVAAILMSALAVNEALAARLRVIGTDNEKLAL